MAAAASSSPGRQASVPPGTICAYLGEVAPTGWLLAYGQEVSKADYPALAGLCGSKYGGETATTFVLPDLRSRTIFGKGNMGGVSADLLTVGIDEDVLGQSAGAQNGSPTIDIDVPSLGGGGVAYATPEDVALYPPCIILSYIIKT